MMTLRVLGWALYTLAASALVGLAAVAASGPATLSPLGVDALAVRLDLASTVLLVLILGVGAVVAGYSTRHLSGEPQVGRYAAGLGGAVFGLALAVTALHLPLLWVGWVAATWSLITLVRWRHTTDVASSPGAVCRVVADRWRPDPAGRAHRPCSGHRNHQPRSSSAPRSPTSRVCRSPRSPHCWPPPA